LLGLAACAAPGASPSPASVASPTTAAATAAAPTAAAPTTTAAATTAPTATAAAATDAPSIEPTTAPTAALTLPPPNPACEKDNLELKNPGRLTLSTDTPAFPPWWGGDPDTQYPNEPEGGSGWNTSDPYSMEGFEGSVAYAIADALGFAEDEVDWVQNAVFEQAFAPGEKPFDFHMAQVAILPERAEAIDFSDPYFDSNQSLIAMTPNEITDATTIAELKDFRLGAAANTTSFALIDEVIDPSVEEMVYPDNDTARTALVNGQIDGLIVDLSTAFYMRDGQIEDYDTPDPEATIVGQFGPPAPPDFVGAVLELDSPLTECVNYAIATIKANGTHQALLDEWINTGEDIPFIQ
jgi:polar amino acid transport system substrate-binding protein